jgi:hypothetical protein
MTSQFSPEAFLDLELSAPTERRAPLPVGDYVAVIGDVKARAWQGVKDTSKSGIAWDIPVTLDVPAELQSELGLPPTLQFKDSIMLDLTESGTIDNSKGKNGGLRRYRDACDLNKPGDTFSARRMTGCVVKIKINHELYQEQIVERIGGVVKA